VVVLAACSSGEGVEAMGTGSLADAFLSAGAEVVIATTRPVDDGLAQRLVAAFYAHDGARHPAAALAAAQQQLNRSMPASAWGAFEVRLGRPPR
jgi:CHAT domain-containing protein